MVLRVLETMSKASNNWTNYRGCSYLLLANKLNSSEQELNQSETSCNLVEMVQAYGLITWCSLVFFFGLR